MARTVLPIVGAVVGSFFGAPQLGFAIGSLIGNAVDPQRIKGPRVGDVNLQTSQEGAPRPIVYGVAAVMGNLIDRGPLNKVITEERQGKGGGPVVENESLFMTFAIRICEGPVEGISRIWEDERLVYDVTDGSEILADSNRYAAGFTLYLGTEDQLPDPDLETIHGVGNTPAHRGTCYIVFKEKNLTDRRGSIPQFRFEVNGSICPQTPGLVQANTFAATFIGTGRATIRAATNGVYASSATTAANSTNPVEFKRLSNALSLISDQGFVPANDNPPPGTADLYQFVAMDENRKALTEDGNSGVLGYWDGPNWRAYLFPEAGTPTNWVFGLSNDNRSSNVWFSSTHVYLGFTESSIFSDPADSITYRIYRWPLSASGTYVLPDASSIKFNDGFAGSNYLFHRDRAGLMHCYNPQSNIWRVFNAGLSLVESFSPPFTVGNPIGVDGPFLFYCAGSTTVTGIPALFVRRRSDFSLVSETNLPFLNDSTEPFNFSMSFNDEVIVINFGGLAVTVDYSPNCSGPGAVGGNDLAGIVEDVASRCDIDSQDIDTSSISGIPVRGFVVAGLYNGGDAIDALRRVFFFDPSEQDGKVVFSLRGGPSVETITEADLVDAPESAKRGQALEFPRKMHLDYQNAEIGYAPAKATAARSSADVRVVGETSIEAPVVLTSDEAAQTADKLLKVTWAEAEGEVKFDLGTEFLRLTPADPITLNLRNTSRRLRITKTEMQRGTISVTAMTDRVSSYTSSATGPVLRQPTRPPEAFAGPTTLAVMDIPALLDTNDQLGVYLAVTGQSTGWGGARVQYSVDGGASWTDLADIRRGCRIGTLMGDVTAALVGPVDATNTLAVDFTQYASDLPSFTDEQWLSERGAVAVLRGDGSAEIMQYRDAVPAGGSSSSSSSDVGIWTLSPLIRGRLNSGATSHDAGAVVVFLDDAVFVELPSTLLGRELTFRAISFGETPEGSSFEQSFTFIGRSQIEMPVLDLEVSEDSSGVVTASWTRRDRFGSDIAPILSTNWQGYRVTFTGDTSDSLTTVATTVTYDSSGLGSSSVAVSVAQLNRITGAGPAVMENT